MSDEPKKRIGKREATAIEVVSQADKRLKAAHRKLADCVANLQTAEEALRALRAELSGGRARRKSHDPHRERQGESG